MYRSRAVRAFVKVTRAGHNATRQFLTPRHISTSRSTQHVRSVSQKAQSHSIIPDSINQYRRTSCVMEINGGRLTPNASTGFAMASTIWKTISAHQMTTCAASRKSRSDSRKKSTSSESSGEVAAAAVAPAAPAVAQVAQVAMDESKWPASSPSFPDRQSLSETYTDPCWRSW